MQVTILLLIGGTAAAASFTHVHDLAVRHGQKQWMGWADAIVLELLSIALGLEIRRRRRAGQAAGQMKFVIGAVLAAAGLSLAAQVAGAEPSVWGWIVAALPAAAFLALVKILLSRPAGATPEATGEHHSEDSAPASPLPTTPETPSAPLTTAATAPAARRVLAGPPLPAELVTAARDAADLHHLSTGRPMTRDDLRAALGVSADTATNLLTAITGRD
jgi:hypothetical protein